GKTGGRANLHQTFIQYVGKNIEAYESSTPMRKMKSEDAGVKNSILTPGGEKKRRHHRISETRKKNSDNICKEKIMAILEGASYNSTAGPTAFYTGLVHYSSQPYPL
nr:hypothetical protein [Tanacetum cinerariifolium]